MAKIQQNRKNGYRVNNEFVLSPNSGYNAFKQATIYTNIYNYLDAGDVTLPYTSMAYYNGSIIPSELYNWENLVDGNDFFHYAYYIKEIDLNLSKLEYGNNMFNMCSALTSAKLGNTTNLVDASYMFAYCSNLTEIEIDTSNINYMGYMFRNCTNLTTIPQLDTSNVTDMNNAFYQCFKLTNLGGFKNLGVSLDLSSSTLLTVDSLMNVINNLKDLTGGTAQTLTLGSTNLAKLTDEQKAIATNKNWILK